MRLKSVKLKALKCFALATLVFGLLAIPLATYAEKPTSIRFVIGSWAPPVLKPFFEKFEKETGIRVEIDDYEFRKLLDIIEIRQKAEDENVDIFFVDAPLVPSYAVRGFMKPLDEYFTKEEIEATWPKAAVEVGYWGGTLWAPPINNSSQVLFYNKTLFKEAGLAYPPVDVEQRWTWKQMVDAAKKIADPDRGIWGFTFDQVNRYYQLQPLPESAGGGSGVSEDGLSVKGHLTNAGWIKAFTFYHDLFKRWKISPRGPGPVELPPMFGAGKIGLFAGGLWNIPDFVEAGVDFAVAPHPYFAEGVPITSSNSWHIGIWSHTRNLEAAVKLLRYLTMDPEVSNHWLEKHGQFPSDRATLEYIMEEPRYAEQPWIAYRIGAYEAQHTAVVRARTPAFLEFEEILLDTFEDIRNGADPKASLQMAESRIERAMARYRK